MAETRRPIYSPIHTDHGLLSPAKADGNFNCSACRVGVKDGNRIYKCSEAGCKFKAHELCAKTHDCEEAPHIKHKHKLYRKLNVPDENLKFCIVCRRPIEGIRYWCPERSCRSRVMVHPLCSRVMPRKLHEYVPDFPPVTDKQVFHSIHDPYHGPLTFRSANEDFECGACKVKENGRRSMYHCERCGFRMHRLCATLQEKETHTPHRQHKLKQILEEPKVNSLKCDKCHKPVQGMRYACQVAKCSNLVVHPMCLQQENPIK